jgi:hypothetical protein
MQDEAKQDRPQDSRQSSSSGPMWQPPELPDDGKPRMYRVYGYVDTGDARRPLGGSIGQQGCGTTERAYAIALRDQLAEDRPEYRWVVEWSLLYV